MEALRETALLGTDKKALDVQQLPEEVRQVLKETPMPDPEGQFLEANTFHCFYESAGRLPVKFTGTIDETVIEEEAPCAPNELMDVLKKIELVDHQLKESALSRWLEILIDKKLIVSPESLVELITEGKSASNQTKAKIASVIGKKGMWILENDPSLSYPVAPAGDHIWQEGTMQERKNMFSALRNTNPDAALTLLKSTWSTESIVNKKSFIEQIKETSVPTDLPFLEELYDEFKHHPKEKKTEKECRRLVGSILLRSTSSPLYTSTTDYLGKYMVKPKKGIVGFVTGQASGSFRIPDAEDDFWNPKTMEEIYGFEVKNYDIAIYGNVLGFWLSCFIEYLPFDFWLKSLNTDYKKAVQFWLLDKTTISGEVIPIFLQPMVNNAQDQNNNELALQLLHQSSDGKNVLPLLKVMHPKDFESFVTNNNHLDNIQILANGPFDGDRSWSLSFSESVLNNAFKLSEQNGASTPLGKVIAQFAHHNSIDALYHINNKARETSAYHNWNTAIFQLVHPMLDIRNKIHALKK